MTAAVRHVPDSPNGTPPYDAVTWQQLANNEIKALWQSAVTVLAYVSGTNDIIASSVASVVSPLTAYTTGLTCWLVPLATNTGGMTVNFDSVGVVNLKDASGATLAGGAFASGTIY